MRIGIGYDVHKLIQGRKLVLGGVEIPNEKNIGLDGHSDADVLLHAICDALLGAIGEGDIGQHFPNTDEKFKNISSLVLLENVLNLIKNKNYSVVNIDAVLIAEEPKIAPYAMQMKKNISKILSISENDIGIKATTNERMGFVGRNEGMCAHAVALIKEDNRK